MARPPFDRELILIKALIRYTRQRTRSAREKQLNARDIEGGAWGREGRRAESAQRHRGKGERERAGEREGCETRLASETNQLGERERERTRRRVTTSSMERGRERRRRAEQFPEVPRPCIGDNMSHDR